MNIYFSKTATLIPHPLAQFKLINKIGKSLIIVSDEQKKAYFKYACLKHAFFYLN